MMLQIIRDIITEAGYGEYYIHGTGHGVGKKVHEEPYIYYDEIFGEDVIEFDKLLELIKLYDKIETKIQRVIWGE